MIQIDSKILPETAGAFIVGGSIRDMLIGRTPIDYDVAVLGDPFEFARQVERRTNGRTVEIGKADKMIIRVVSQNNIIDISKTKEASIEKDLQKRDFTINAMAYDLSSHCLIDPVGAQRDLKAKTIRMVSKDVFRRDPVRLLRAYRIAAEFQFQIEPQTKAAIEKHAMYIQRSAGERVREELFKMLRCTDSYPYLRQMADAGLLFALIPELSAMKRCRQNQHHAFNVFEHTLHAFSHLEGLLGPNKELLIANNKPAARRVHEKQIPLLKLAMLLHDVAKPAVLTRSADGKIHFYGHERQSARVAEAICRRLKCARRDIAKIHFLVRHHVRPRFLFTAIQEQKDAPRALTRFFMQCAEQIFELLIIAAADCLAKETQPGKRSSAFIAFLNGLMVDFESNFKRRRSGPRLITGHDLFAEFGLEPSPLYKKILQRVEEERLSEGDMSRQDALKLAGKLIREQKSEVRSQKSDDR